MIHKAHDYFLHPQHKITVDVIGLGGTGSQVLNNLARMNQALMKLNHPGLHVRAWDPDTVTDANMGRQLFSQADVGHNKAVVLVTRVNRFFASEWQAMPTKYTGKTGSNILITCVDTAKARLTIADNIKKVKPREPEDLPYYWLDIGNKQKTGQVVLGTLHAIPQSGKGCRKVLPDVIKKLPQIKKVVEEKQGPSCSLAEALEKQDLFINSILAQFGCNLLWKLFREGQIRHHGCYVNLDTCTVNPIRIA